MERWEEKSQHQGSVFIRDLLIGSSLGNRFREPRRGNESDAMAVIIETGRRSGRRFYQSTRSWRASLPLISTPPLLV